MKKKFFSILILLLVTSSIYAQWSLVGTSDFANVNYGVKLKVSNGVPYVAFRNAENKLSVMKYNGSQWEYVGSSNLSTGYPSGINLEVINGVPYVAYGDPSLYVKKFDGSDWLLVGNTIGQNVYNLSLAFDKYNVPYVLYGSSYTSISYFLRKYNEQSNIWEDYFTSPSLHTYMPDVTQPYQFTLKINEDKPFIGYSSNKDSYVPHLMTAVPSVPGPVWTNVPVSSSSIPNSSNFKLGIGLTNEVFVAYNTSNLVLNKLPSYSYTGCNPFCFSSLNDLIISNTNVPYVLLNYNNNKVIVMNHDGASFKILDSASTGFSNGSPMSLDLDGQTPYIAYINSMNQITVLKYTTPDPTANTQSSDFSYISCSPNPTSGQVTLSSINKDRKFQIDLISSYGQIMESNLIENTSVFNQTILGPTGIYSLRVRDTRNGEQIIYKIVKE
jgi:hypothetical protein